MLMVCLLKNKRAPAIGISISGSSALVIYRIVLNLNSIPSNIVSCVGTNYSPANASVNTPILPAISFVRKGIF